MKRLGMILMASLMVLGFTQCKKEQPTNQNETEGVRITLTVDGGNGSKVNVNPNASEGYATVAFETGDVIYVGYKNNYVGQLTYSGSSFAGTITAVPDMENQEPLHFYFLGGKGFTPTIEGNTATVNISDQTERYPVISYNTSNESFTGAGSYSAKLQNKVSIMKFNVTTPSSAAICITGMNNTVSVNFGSPNGTDNGFSYSKTGAGVIKMAGGSGSPAEKWAIVLPQAALEETGDAFSEDNVYFGTRPALSVIGSNQYLSGGVNMSVNTEPPLTLEALTGGTIEVQNPQSGMKYSLNGVVREGEPTSITVSVGDKVQFYGDGTSFNRTNIAGGTAQVKVYGNIMSLVDETGYASATTLADYAFFGLFSGNTNLTDASGLLLPATTLAGGCYYGMFSDCTSLTTAPALPATTLATRCYYEMFKGCTSLTTAPALPAETLANNCYWNMFNNCTSLTAAPSLPAETLANNCYNGMFQNCSNLEMAPELPAESLEDYCYQSMFEGCTALTTAPALPAMSLAEYCYESMFEGCTNLMAAPELPATVLADYCYRNMFYGCTNLNSVKCLATDISAEGCTTGWLNGVASTGTFTTPSTTNWSTVVSGIPSGWTRKNPDGTPYVTENTITWYIDSSILHADDAGDEVFTQDGITLALPGEGGSSFMDYGFYVLSIEEEITFTSTVGNISKIEISSDAVDNLPEDQKWSYDVSTHIVKWEDTPAPSVTLSASSGKIWIYGISQIVFTVQ